MKKVKGIILHNDNLSLILQRDKCQNGGGPTTGTPTDLKGVPSAPVWMEIWSSVRTATIQTMGRSKIVNCYTDQKRTLEQWKMAWSDKSHFILHYVDSKYKCIAYEKRWLQDVL